jgi:hypothetical protein
MTNPMRPICALTPSVALLAALLAGCGSEPVFVDSSVLRLRLDEYRITPQLVHIHPGRLKIVAVNTGILTHNVRIEEDHPDRRGNPIVLGGTATAHPGDSVSGKVTLKRGRYKLVDTIANHKDLGDYGTLIVD